jgi:hypothetical protein
MLRADRPEERGAAKHATAGGEGAADASLEALVGRTSAQLDRARAGVALAAQLRERLQDEIDRLERRLADAEAERLELLGKVDDRDRRLKQILGSRSWRWAQAVRRILGRR